MGFDHVCNTGLVLGLGFSSEYTTPVKASVDNIRPKMPVNICYEPDLTLGLISGSTPNYVKFVDENIHVLNKQQSGGGGGGGGGGADSGGSSFSNLSVKREREIGCFEEVDTTTMDHKLVSSRVVSDEDDDGAIGRKKLRLTKAQSALLEESFKHHSTLNPKQKQELARELKLRPRQVEVWFQNRRARTKLKQTEVDCEYLKKCCETLTDENRRLQKELQELKALKVTQPLYMQLPAATLTMCPSCERVGAGGGTTDTSSSKSPSSCPYGSKPHFYNPFTNSSAAC